MSYTASLSTTPGRPGFSISFRHPLKLDSKGKPGLKMRRGKSGAATFPMALMTGPAIFTWRLQSVLSAEQRRPGHCLPHFLECIDQPVGGRVVRVHLFRTHQLGQDLSG